MSRTITLLSSLVSVAISTYTLFPLTQHLAEVKVFKSR